jgi:hypothetical protein
VLVNTGIPFFPLPSFAMVANSASAGIKHKPHRPPGAQKVLNSSMANPLELNSKNYKQTTQAPDPVLDVLPTPGDYLGSMRASDAATTAAGVNEPPPPYPGSGMPGQPWKTINAAPMKRGLRR